VHDRDVVGLHEPQQVVRVRVGHALVGLLLRRPEVTTVPFGSVQVVVDALRDAEEIGLPRDDEPPGVDAHPTGVREQRPEHLGDAAPTGGGIDVPHDAALEHVLRPSRRRLEGLVRVGRQHLAETFGRQDADIDLVDECHATV
jgi:hypothetical protein